ncbi:hypothetical protein JCM33374_g6186 [Metschnikowia sp. JCM 33374]|nr:hypothetical protein JCM33374_g6186 [Metschnikowia sp. JCM 33374]
MMTEVATIFKNSYLGDGVDEDFDGDIPCFSHVADLAMGALMAYAFPSKTTGEPVDSENTSAEDEIYANLPENISSVSGRVRQFIRAINENDVLGSLFDNAVGSSTHTARMEKLKETWEETLNNESPLSEYEMIDSFLYFKDPIIEVCKEYNNLHPQNQMGALETPEWEYLTLVRDILGIFVRPTKCLQNTDYVMVYAIIPMVDLLLDKLQGMNTASVRGVYPNIALGITAACDILKKYYPIYGEDCGRMRLLYLATVLHPQFKLVYFHNIDSFPRELITCIKKDLEALYQLYKEYYGDSPNGGSFDGVSRHNHQPSPESEEQAMFAFLRKYAVVNKENNEVDTYLSESVEDSTVMDYYRRTKKRYPILYQLAKDILAIPAASAPTEAFVSALGDMTRKQTRVLPATTKMLAVVKDMV